MLPKLKGFEMPAEWEHHSRTWMAWPCSTLVWRTLPDGSMPAQTAFVNIAKAISQFEPVFVGVRDDDAEAVTQRFTDTPAVTVVVIKYNDIWLRDTAPTFLIDRATSIVAAVDWEFNCWGGIGNEDGSPGLPYDMDVVVANQIIDIALPSGPVFQANFVMEGGTQDK